MAQSSRTSFFRRYAEGKWNSFVTPHFPSELLGESSSITHEGVEQATATSNVETSIPPDLTQSVEDVYRSFILDSTHQTRSRRMSNSNALLTPTSESNAFSFSLEGGQSPHDGHSTSRQTTQVPGDWIHPGDRHMGPPSSNNEENYDSIAARRYQELGYLEAPMPQDEVQRRRAVRKLKPFNLTIDTHLDRIARLGKTMFATNASLISIVDTDEVQFTFNGQDPYMVPRGTPMCSHAVLLKHDEPLVVLDTLKDWRFKGNKVVTDTLKVRFYAGYPMRTEEGENIGVFCVLDDKPRESFGAEDREQLKELTAMTMRELQGRIQQRQAQLRDMMQRTVETFNREAVSGAYSVDQLLDRVVDHISSALSVEGVLIFDAINSRASNEPQSWQVRNGIPVPLIAASKDASTLSESLKDSEQSNVINIIFREYSSGVVYTQGESIPEAFVNLLPEKVTAAAAIPVFRKTDEPFALLCVYTMQPDYDFQIPGPVLSFLSAMGLVLCTVRQKQVLSLADKAKIDFIANISHELRTPLHGVMASCDLLSETVLSETQESFLSTAKQCASSLTETINHVLDFTKSTSQSTSIMRVPVDLAQLIEETMTSCWLGRLAKTASEAMPIGELYAPHTLTPPVTANRATVEPVIDIEPHPNWMVMLDKAGLRRILVNLIGNSMKFTQDGYVKVGLYRGVSTDPSLVAVEIVVEDSGSGISDAFIREKLFHPFSQEKPFAQGIGLGLAIVRAILKTPGVDGAIDVHSKVGFGTQMILRLQAPAVMESSPSLWPRLPIPHVSQNLPSISFIGFPEDANGIQYLVDLIRQHLYRWYGKFKEEESPECANLLIVNGDDIGDEFLSEPRRYEQRILVLSSSPIEPALLKRANDLSSKGSLCLISLKPVGPHALARLFSKLMDNTQASPPKTPEELTCSPIRSSRSTSPLLMAKRSPILEALKTRRMQSDVSSHQSKSSPEMKPITNNDQAMKLRVLVVEDNAVNRKVLSAYLRKRRFEFVEAENGQEGVQAFQKYPTGYFDICLMDLQMPVMDGFQAAINIRSLESKRNGSGESARPLKIYALSGLATPEDKQRASEIGFDGYLVKPVSFKMLDSIFQSLPRSVPWRVSQ
ncbi:His Kinase A domain containing protein [Serendipita sp. 396]|nr:His Kinase A domain containing protein [Serendipita sp. 396]